MGKSTGKALFTIGGFFLGAGGWGQKLFGMVGNSLGAGLYGASLMSTIWTATHTGAGPSYSFSTATNAIANDQMIPLVYGTRQYNGPLITWQAAGSSASSMKKDVVIAEGEIKGVQGVTANCMLIGGTQTVFEIENIAYSDATVEIHQTNSPTGNDKRMTLVANGVTTTINMQGAVDISSDSSNDFCCNIGLFVQHIEKLGNGWRIKNYCGCSIAPENIASISTTSCYKTPVAITGSQETSSTYTAYTGSSTQAPPTNYATTGSYKNTAWIRANLVATSSLSYSNPNIACIIKGKLVYDTRTSTTAYSENPAMCLRDYLLNKRYGMGRWLTEDMLDTDSFEECADYCDATVTYSDAYGITVSEPRYTLNLILAQKRKHIENIQDILAVFGGFLSISGDKIYCRMEKQETVSYDFNSNNMSEVKFDYDGLTNCPNQYSIKYYDPAQNWAQISVQVNDTADQQSRGAIIPKEVSLQGCTNQGQALRLGRIYKAVNRLNGAIISFTTGTFAMHLQPGDIVGITYRALSGMPFRVLSTSEENGKWKLQAQQYNLSIYDDALGAQLNLRNYVVGDTALTTSMGQVQNASGDDSYYEQTDGSYVYSITVSWDNLNSYYLKRYVIYYSVDSGTSWQIAGYSAVNTFVHRGVLSNKTYEYNVIAESTAGTYSSDCITSPIYVNGVAATTRKYTTTIGNGVDLTYTVTHNLNTTNIINSIRRAISPYDVVYPTVSIINANSISVEFTTVPATNEFSVTILA